MTEKIKIIGIAHSLPERERAFIERLRNKNAPSSILPWEWEDEPFEAQLQETLEVPSWIYLQH